MMLTSLIKSIHNIQNRLFRSDLTNYTLTSTNPNIRNSCDSFEDFHD